MRKQICHMIAMLALQTGSLAGLTRRSPGVAHMRGEGALCKQPQRHMIAMPDIQTGRKAGQLQKRSGAVRMRTVVAVGRDHCDECCSVTKSGM